MYLNERARDHQDGGAPWDLRDVGFDQCEQRLPKSRVPVGNAFAAGPGRRTRPNSA